MTSTPIAALPPQPPIWGKAIASPGQEFPLSPLTVIAGQIPDGLRGSLYRNGPGRLERGRRRVGHWFDGDGAILAVHFTGQSATGTYRYVQTAGYQAETEAGTLLWGGYGMTPPGPLWQRWGKPLKNAANTSVLALPDRLLALWEGGPPYALDLQTLDTVGVDDLGQPTAGLTYSAHPKRDPRTRDIYNFGVAMGPTATLNLFRSDASGRILQQGSVALAGLPLVHDFVLAGPYLVFCVPPVQINLLPAALSWCSFSDAMSWRPDQGTQLIIVDRDTLEVVSRGQTDPWFQWHFSNGYGEADGTVVLDLVRYADFQTNQYLKEVATGQTQTLASGRLWRLRLDPQTGRMLSQDVLIDRGCEFPVVPPQQVGQADSDIYLAMHRADADLRREVFGAIARFSAATDTLTVADLGPYRYPSEPIFAPDAVDPTRGWVLTVVFDGKANTSEVWIFDSEQLQHEPVCRLALPTVVPLSFHGTWQPAKYN